VVQSLCLFAVIAGGLKQFPRPEHDRLLGFCNACRYFALFNLKRVQLGTAASNICCPETWKYRFS
jgi:hypothetical protein